MKAFGALIASALFVALITMPAAAQQPGAPSDQHHPDAKTGSSATAPPDPPTGMKSPMPMMDMCRQMMGMPMAGGPTGMPMAGEMTGMPMMGGAAAIDPKERASMLEMRGEMMKAMGDVMIKHAQRMQGTTGK